MENLSTLASTTSSAIDSLGRSPEPKSFFLLKASAPYFHASFHRERRYVSWLMPCITAPMHWLSFLCERMLRNTCSAASFEIARCYMPQLHSALALGYLFKQHERHALGCTGAYEAGLRHLYMAHDE